MPMRPDDRILSPPRGTLAQARTFAARSTFPSGDADILAYLTEVFRLSPKVGIDPAIVVAQSAEETGNWTSDAWRERRNPAGIGVTDGQDFGYSWADGTAAARGQIVHLIGYAAFNPNPEPGRLTAEQAATVGNYRGLDPRWDALIDSGWAGTVHTIRDLTGKWATDPAYHDKIAARGNLIFPGLVDQTGGPMLDIDVDLVSRHNGLLTTPQARITVHNTGAGNSRQQERAFVANGGGSEGVMYHFAVDETGATQIMPLDRQGIHAGNRAGNETSIAIEMCMNREPWSQIRENTAQLLAAIVTGDSRLVYGSFGKANFSLERVVEHRDWPGANPNCPERLIATDGGAERIVARARAIIAGSQPPPVVKPHPVGNERKTDPDYRHSVRRGDDLFLWHFRVYHPAHDVPTFEWASDSSAKGPMLKAGKGVTIYSVVTSDDVIFGTTRVGWRVRMADLVAP